MQDTKENESVMFLDIETTGLPPKGADWRTDFDKFPYIVSIAYKMPRLSIIGERFTPEAIFYRYFILNQKGCELPKESIEVHGITQEQCDKSEHTLKSISRDLLENAIASTKIIGHNPYFDTSIIKANILREFGPNSLEHLNAMEAFDKSKRIDMIRIAQKYFGGRWMKLHELYTKLFNEEFNAHNALEDIMAVERCYNWFKEKEAI